MNPKQLAIKVIIHDMKYEQLIHGLRDLGFQTDIHGSDLCAVVAELLGIPADDITLDWLDTYMGFIKQAPLYPITDTGDALLPLAEKMLEEL